MQTGSPIRSAAEGDGIDRGSARIQMAPMIAKMSPCPADSQDYEERLKSLGLS